MRIYNGTDSSVDLPLNREQRLSIPANSASGDFMGSTEFITLLISAYQPTQVAIIAFGPFEMNLCASIPGTHDFVVQSIEDAIIRFSDKDELKELQDEDLPKSEGPEVIKPNVEEEPVIEEVVEKPKKVGKKK